jgi:hypothetical protein
VLFTVLALALLPRFASAVGQAQTVPTHSFINYYTAAALLSEGVDVSQFYDDDWYRQQTQRFAPGIEDIFTPHLPPSALMLLPLVPLGHDDARAVWIVFNVVLFALAFGWLLWREVPRGWLLPALIALPLMYQPLYSNIRYGQIYTLLFALTVVTWYAYRQRRDGVAGGAHGAMIIFKLTGMFLLLPLALECRWRALLWSVVVMLGVALLTLPVIGVQPWLTYIKLMPGYAARPSFAVTAYQSLPGLFKHLFFYHAEWNAQPLWDAPLLAALLTGVSSLAVIAVTVWRAWQTPRSPLVFAALVIAHLLTSPATLEYHFALMLFPLLLLCFDAPHWSLRARLVLLMAIALLAVDYDYWGSRWGSGALVALAYPRLWGGLLLWALATHEHLCYTERCQGS